MILVRTEMQCKWGRVQEVVDTFKAMSARFDTQDVIKRTRILTDLSGRFDTVIVESEIESIDAYFALLNAAFADPELQAQQAAIQDHAQQSGSRAFYTIEATYELKES